MLFQRGATSHRLRSARLVASYSQVNICTLKKKKDFNTVLSQLTIGCSSFKGLWLLLQNRCRFHRGMLQYIYDLLTLVLLHTNTFLHQSHGNSYHRTFSYNTNCSCSFVKLLKSEWEAKGTDDSLKKTKKR